MIFSPIYTGIKLLFSSYCCCFVGSCAGLFIHWPHKSSHTISIGAAALTPTAIYFPFSSHGIDYTRHKSYTSRSIRLRPPSTDNLIDPTNSLAILLPHVIRILSVDKETNPYRHLIKVTVSPAARGLA